MSETRTVQNDWPLPSDPIVIEPTALKDELPKVHMDIAVVSLLNVQSIQIASFRQAIWARFNIMLLSNSLLFAALTGQAAATLGAWRYKVPIVGLGLCAVWAIMLVADGFLMFHLVATASKFRSPTLHAQSNIFAVMKRGSAWGQILYGCGMLVIGLIAYLHYQALKNL